MPLIPINTDAPLYYFPYATMGLIVVNIVCFAVTGFAMNDQLAEPWLLHYGDGLNPLEWIPAAFAHQGFMHIIGNMFFLWGFGLVVEGKLGWKIFIPLYLGMAAAWGLGVDLLTLHRTDAYVLQAEFSEYHVDNFEDFKPKWDKSDTGIDARTELNNAKGHCLGASGVIFSLMAISLVWAPKNEMHIVGFIVFRAVSFDVTILVFSLWFLALNILELLLSKFAMGSSGLHMIGCVIGFAVGVVFLKLRWVDCEKWDLFSVLSGNYGRFAEEGWAVGGHSPTGKTYGELPLPTGTEEPTNEASTAIRAQQVCDEMKQVNALIDSGDVFTAAEILMTMRLHVTDIYPNESRMRALAMGLLQAQAFDDAEIWLQEYLDRYPEQNAWARIRMAQLLLIHFKRPAAALLTLKGLSLADVNEKMQALAKKVVRTAKEQIRNGVPDEEPEW
ncbi:MAG: rhomboid family intramembrane serine protease [Planctomycetota bacterium]|nr:MAG: rhomboid family intramembrane serine protease [Planctomycetota bacterium]